MTRRTWAVAILAAWGVSLGWLARRQLFAPPEARLAEAGLHSKQTGMDNVRGVCGCPVAGVTPHELLDARPVIREFNEMLVGSAARYPSTKLVDWFAYSQGHPEWFWDDGTHLRPEGAEAYATMIAAAIAAN